MSRLRLRDDELGGCGVKVLSRERWYAGGYCGICGDRDVIPRAVRYWDPDDGWRMGVLCHGCHEEYRDRGPQASDYAYRDQSAAEKIEVDARYGDLDSCYADWKDGLN